jgi:adenylosuccinate synthase
MTRSPRPRIIVLSGPVSSGKTTLAHALAQRYGFGVCKTKDVIRTVLGTAAERSALQGAGDALDRRTAGRWIADALVRGADVRPPGVLVDAIRIEAQIDAIRQAFGPTVTHVHLTAQDKELSRRYRARRGSTRELASYSALRQNLTESRVEELRRIADIVIDTGPTGPEEVVVRVAAHLGLYGRGYQPLVDVLVGGQYGSEGKGHIASYLAQEYDVLVRVGGPNAGHKVFELPEPYTFHQLPSGTRRNMSAQILIGPGAVQSVPKLMKEIAECKVSQERLSIDPQVMIIEKADIRAEARLRQQIGSTAQGVGRATSRKVLRTDARPKVRLAHQLQELRPYIRETQQILEDAFSEGKKIFLEGTQGTGLSLHHGAFPYVTSRDTTVSACLSEAGIAPGRLRKSIVVCRTYPIRVQSPHRASSGPMLREVSFAEVARRSGLSRKDLESAERTSTTNRPRRVSEFDWVLLRRAATLNGPTDVALTFVDYLANSNTKARRFEQLTEETIRFVEEVERVAAAPVSLISTRFHFRSIIDRRAW